MHIQSTTTFHQDLHTASLRGDCCAAGLLQTLSYVLPGALGTTKCDTFTGAGQPATRDLCHHRGTDLQAIATRLLVPWADPHFHVMWCAEGACSLLRKYMLAPAMRLSPEDLRSLCSRGVPNDEPNCGSGDAGLACRGRDPQDRCRKLAGRACDR